MVQRRRASSRRKAGRSAPTSGRQTGSGRSSTPDPLVVAALSVVDVGRRGVVGRPEQHQFRAGRVDGWRSDFRGRGSGKGRVQAVCRRDRLRTGVFEELQLMVEVVDGTDT